MYLRDIMKETQKTRSIWTRRRICLSLVTLTIPCTGKPNAYPETGNEKNQFEVTFQKGQIGGVRKRYLIVNNQKNVQINRCTLSYDVWFEDEFDFHHGGKLPGLAGGSAPTGCRTLMTEGFSVRPMWRANGAAELYVYRPWPRLGPCGESFGRQPSEFEPGKWHTVSLTVALDPTPGSGKDQAMLTIDQRAIVRTEILLRRQISTAIDTLLVHIFFGGSGNSAASPRTQAIRVRNFSLLTDQ